MAELFEAAFSPYGFVHRYPRKAKLVEFEWSLESDRDGSFELLLKKPTMEELGTLSPGEFVSFLAGFFDAEGTIVLNRKRRRYNPEVSIRNSDRGIVEFLFQRLRELGYSAKIDWRKQADDRSGIVGRNWTGNVVIWRFEEVRRFLRLVPIRHRERVEKAALVQELVYAGSDENQDEVARRWKILKKSVQNERNNFLEMAKTALAERLDVSRSPDGIITGMNQAPFRKRSSE